MSRQLFAAIRAGRIAAVMDALAGGADPNARDRSGMTALNAALTRESVAIADALIAAGADANAADGDGLRPLDFAMLYGGHRAAKLLIDRGAEVDYVRTDGDPALMAAAGAGDVKLVEMFLAAGANPNTPRAIDGLSVADIQVIAAQSADAPAGMKRSSRRILDVLAAAGATVRTIDQIEAIKDAQRRDTAVQVEDAKAVPLDPAIHKVRRFRTLAKSAVFQAMLNELAALCERPPGVYRPTELRMHQDADAIYECRFDRQKLLARFGKADGKMSELLVDLEDLVLTRGFYLLQNTDIEGDHVRLLFPTSDPFAVIYAHGVNTNGGVDLNELLSELRKVYALVHFVVTDCGHDTIAGSYLREVTDEQLNGIGEILDRLCPTGNETDDEYLSSAADDTSRSGFYLWWD